jgi:hypothetical protein
VVVDDGVTTLTLILFGSSVPWLGVGRSSSQLSLELWTTDCATASKNGPHAALPAQSCARTPPVFCTSCV